MAAPYNPPKKGEDFVIYIAVMNATNATSFVLTPTIAAGDFQVKKDAGAFANLTTLPTQDAAGDALIKISLSTTEMDADSVIIRGIDQTATKEWTDFVMSIPTTA